MRVGTWNVENLFLPAVAASAVVTFGASVRDVFAEKVAGLAETITRADLDVVAVQEIGDEAAFAALIAELGQGWTGKLSTHFDSPHTIRNGILSRLPIEHVTDHTEIPAALQGVPVDDDQTPLTHLGRGVLHVRVTGPRGVPVDVVSLHLKSKLIRYPGRRFSPRDEGERAQYAAYGLYRRAAEAVSVRALADALIDGEGDSRHVIVAGDFNDEPHAATTQIAQGPPGSEIGTPGENRPDQGDAYRLFNLAPLIPEEVRYSRVYRGRGELIDHIFVTNATRKVTVGATTLTGTEELESIDDDPTRRRNSPYSDHALVAATFDFPAEAARRRPV